MRAETRHYQDVRISHRRSNTIGRIGYEGRYKTLSEGKDIMARIKHCGKGRI